jgi:hypothetical protein
MAGGIVQIHIHAQRWLKCSVTLGSFSASVSNRRFSSPRETEWIGLVVDAVRHAVQLPSRSCIMRACTGTVISFHGLFHTRSAQGGPAAMETTRLMLRPA